MLVFRGVSPFTNMGVSKNKGTPKWMVKIMENPMNKWMIWGYPYFWKHPYWFSSLINVCFQDGLPQEKTPQKVAPAIQVLDNKNGEKSFSCVFFFWFIRQLATHLVHQSHRIRFKDSKKIHFILCVCVLWMLHSILLKPPNPPVLTGWKRQFKLVSYVDQPWVRGKKHAA